MPLENVNRGDLITAEKWNQLLEEMRLLEARVAILEDNDAQVEIIELQFAEPLRVGDMLRILGRNFRSSAGTVRVFIDGHETLPNPDTFTNARIEVIVPLQINPPAAGKQVQLLVGNARTNDVRRLTVFMRDIALTGPVDVQWVGLTPAQILPGRDMFWEYTARSRASRTETFTITPRVQPAGLLTPGQFQILSADRTTPLPASQLTLDHTATTPTRFFLRVNPFPPIPQNTNFSLSVELSTGGQVYTASDPEAFTVGQAAEQPDPAITLTISAIVPETDAAGNPIWIPPNIIRFRQGVPMVEVRLLAEFRAAATYSLTNSTPQNWSVDGGDNQSEYTITPGDVAEGGSRLLRTLVYFIQPDAAAVERPLTVTLQRPGGHGKQEISLILRP
jgi:hypothetical protein